MFAEFNREDFPIVKVKMNGKPESDKDFDDFLNERTKLYDEGKDFTFIFYTENVSAPDIKYSIKMTEYIKNLRKRDYQYLQKSIILINNNKIKWMLDFIFYFQPPVADVYLIDMTEYNFDISKIHTISDTIDGITNIQPSKPLISSIF